MIRSRSDRLCFQRVPLDQLPERIQGERSDRAIDRSSVIEEDHGRNAGHSVLPGDLRALVDIQLEDADSSRELRAHFFEQTTEKATRGAP